MMCWKTSVSLAVAVGLLVVAAPLRRTLAQDTDGDGVPDASDPCIFFPLSNPLDSNLDGIPDECQCGDANGNNSVDSNDLTTIFGCLSGAIPPATCAANLAGGKMEGNGNLTLDSNDLTQVFRALSGLQPNSALTCANRPEGTPPCAGGDYASTLEAIQAVIFDSPVYGCATGICHGVGQQGGLNLSAGIAHSELVGVLSTISPLHKRIEPGEPLLSVLYDKLRAGTMGTAPEFGGSPMPQSATPLLADHLRAVELWIRGGAPADLVVDGTAALLGTCLPEPDPLIIPIPDPPPLGQGVQLQQTPWPLPAQSEDEICMPTFVDFTATNLVPDSARVPCPPEWAFAKGCSDDPQIPCETDAECSAQCVPVRSVDNPSSECFLYHKQTLIQDPQSHHSIIRPYRGAFSYSDSSWGPYTYKFQDPSQPLEGQPCDPADLDPTRGYNPNCSGAVVSQVACLGSGPPDLSLGADASLFASGTAPAIIVSQEPYFEQVYADGVYNVAPMRGVWVWNSHAFNTSNQDSTMSLYLNLEFAEPEDQLYPVRDLFDVSQIFVQNVPPFETREYCTTYTFPRGARVSEFSTHTHKRGVLFRIWEPPNTPCTPGEPACVPRDPLEAFYISTNYADPVQHRFDVPLALDSPQARKRTFLYCAAYDNGSTPTSPPLKRQSTSLIPPLIFGLPLGPGGPCSNAAVACLNEGPNKGALCGGNDSACNSLPDAGDGVCDACPVLGGVTTDDEMFVLFGEYFIP